MCMLFILQNDCLALIIDLVVITLNPGCDMWKSHSQNDLSFFFFFFFLGGGGGGGVSLHLVVYVRMIALRKRLHYFRGNSKNRSFSFRIKGLGLVS